MKTKWMLLGLLLSGFILGVVSNALADGLVAPSTQRAEVRFLEGEIDYGQIALGMANDCLKKSQNNSVKSVCQKIADRENVEIKTMRGWLLVWYQVDYLPRSAEDTWMSSMPMMNKDMMGINISPSGNMSMMPTTQADKNSMSGMMGTPAPNSTPIMTPNNDANENCMGSMINMMNKDMMGTGSSGNMSTMMPTTQADKNSMSGMMGAAAPNSTPTMMPTSDANENCMGSMMTMMSMMGHMKSPSDDPQGVIGLMAGSDSLKGSAYDTAWLEAMIDQHEDVIDRAKRALTYAGHDELRQFAKKTVDDLTTENTAMESLVNSLDAK